MLESASTAPVWCESRRGGAACLSGWWCRMIYWDGHKGNDEHVVSRSRQQQQLLTPREAAASGAAARSHGTRGRDLPACLTMALLPLLLACGQESEAWGWYKTLDYMCHYNQLVDALVIFPFLARELLARVKLDLDTVRQAGLCACRVSAVGCVNVGVGVGARACAGVCV